MQIKDIMSHPVVSCPADSTLDQAARLMWEFDCGIVPVIGDDGRLVGVVTDRDICMAAYTQGKTLSAIPVGTAVAPQVVAIDPGHDGWVVGDEAAILIEFDFEGDTVRRLGMPEVHRHG